MKESYGNNIFDMNDNTIFLNKIIYNTIIIYFSFIDGIFIINIIIIKIYMNRNQMKKYINLKRLIQNYSKVKIK